MSELFLLNYYNGAASHSLNLFLTNKVNKSSSLYALFNAYEAVISTVGPSLQLTPVTKGTDQFSQLQKLKKTILDLKVEPGVESVAQNVYSAHVAMLLGESEECVEILAKLDNLVPNRVNSFRTQSLEDTSVVDRNFIQYCLLKAAVLQCLCQKSATAAEKLFSTHKFSELPTQSNIRGHYWLTVLFNTCFKYWHKESGKNLTFAFVERKLVKNPLICAQFCQYLYSHSRKYLDNGFAKGFSAWFDAFAAKAWYDNKDVTFPDANRSNYSLEAFVYSLLVFRDSHSSGLLSKQQIDKLCDFTLANSFQSIKLFHAMVYTKIAEFSHSEPNLYVRYVKMLDIKATFKNFTIFYSQYLTRLNKQNLEHRLLDTDLVGLVETYALFLQFFLDSLQILDNPMFSPSVYNKNHVIDAQISSQYSKFGQLFAPENLDYLDTVEKELVKYLAMLEDYTNFNSVHVDWKSKFNNSLGVKISKAYFAILSKKTFEFKLSQAKFKSFLNNENDLKDELLQMYKKCLVLNNFQDSRFYHVYLATVMEFYSLDTNSDSVVYILKSLLEKNIQDWTAWRLLIILVNSEFGLETKFQSLVETSKSEDTGLELLNSLNYLIATSSKSAVITLDEKCAIMRLKLAQLEIIGAKCGWNVALGKSVELFSLYSLLFGSSPSAKAEKSVKSKAAVSGDIPAKVQQKIWLFVARMYLEVGDLRESEHAVVEAENAYISNEATFCVSAEILARRAAVLHGKLQHDKTQQSVHEFEKSIEIHNINNSELNYRLNENISAVIGLAYVILQDSAAAVGTQFGNKLVDDLEPSQTQEVVADFLGDSDKYLAVLRVKTMLEDLKYSYKFHTNEKVWQLLCEVYSRIGDRVSYKEALERVVKLQQHSLVIPLQ